MKELDDSTRRLVRYLAVNQEPLWTQYRVRVLVIWVGGDKETLVKWAAQHNLNELPLGIIAVEDETLKPWRINPHVRNTTVLLNRTKPLATLIDFEQGDLQLFHKNVEEHFQAFRRCKGD